MIILRLPRSKKRLKIQWGQKRSDRSRFFKANFDGFWQFSQKVLKIQKHYIPHLKALIYSYYEPEGQGRGLSHITARTLLVKLRCNLTEKVQIFENIFFLFFHHKIHKNEVWATYLTNLERAKCP